MNLISCMSANYVARQLNYQMTGGWSQGDTATNLYFKPIKTFSQRFEELLKEIQGLGFDALDLWLAHLNPSWATPDHLSIAQELLETYGLTVVSLAGGMGRTPEEMLAKIGDGGEGTIGTAVDTGWYGTQGYDATQAIRRLGPSVLHVHLKDVRAAGAHETCRFGDGIVPVRACLRVLAEINYSGAISIEHEPESYNPDEDLKASRELLEIWLNEL